MIGLIRMNILLMTADQNGLNVGKNGCTMFWVRFIPSNVQLLKQNAKALIRLLSTLWCYVVQHVLKTPISCFYSNLWRYCISLAGLRYVTYLLTAFYDTTAKMAAGFGIHHSGDMLLSLQVNEEFLAAFCLFPELKNSISVSLRLKSWRNTNAPKYWTFLPLRVEIHQLGHIITDTSFQHNTVFISISVKEGQKTKKED